MHWPWVNMDMVMLGKMCVCWFLDRQVVPRCPGGLQESRGHVSSLHGWQKHTHTHTLLHTKMACVVGIRIMIARNTCGVLLFGSGPKCVWMQHKHASYWLKHYFYQAARYQPFSHFRKTRTHTETLRQKEYLWGAGCHYWKAIWGVPILWWQGCSLIKHGV